MMMVFEIFAGALIYNLTYAKFQIPRSPFTECFNGTNGYMINITNPPYGTYNTIHITGDILMTGFPTKNLEWISLNYIPEPCIGLCWLDDPWLLYVGTNADPSLQ